MLMVFTTFASADDAARVARTLVEERLIACGNVLPGVRSLYRWEGKVADQLTQSEKALAQLPGYHINFIAFGLVYAIAAILWLRIDSTKPVIPEEQGPEDERRAE